MNSTLHASRIDYSLTGETLILSSLLPTAGPRFLVDVDPDDVHPWSLSKSWIENGWSCLQLESSRFLSLSDALASHSVPAGFELLILNSPERFFHSMRGFEAARSRPALVVLRDLENDAAGRAAIYRQMNSCGYRYAGLAGTYSLWSASPLNVCFSLPQPPSSWPLPSKDGVAVSAFDAVPSAVAACSSGPQQTYLIKGWAFVESPPSVPPAVYIEVRNHRTGLTDHYAAFRCHRPDVSTHFGNPLLEMSGFRALITLNHMMAGSFSIGVLQIDERFRYLAPSAFLIERSLEEYEQNPRAGLARKFLHGTGIEIGALQKPLPLPASCSVRYVERMSLEDLLHHYPELQGLPLQAPDIIENGEELSSIATSSQDFIIANHFLEHCQDPFRTLSNFLRVLRVGGVLFMAVPDKRFTFDFDRPCTSYQTLRETYQTGQRKDRARLFGEWVRSVERLDSQAAAARAVHLDAADYSIHYNVWSVDELLTHLLLARNDLSLPFRILSAVCSDNEAILLIECTGQLSEAGLPDDTLVV